MSIRFQILLFGILGNLFVAAVLLYTSGQRQDVQEVAAGKSLVVLYESAWYQTYNSTLDFNRAYPVWIYGLLILEEPTK